MSHGLKIIGYGHALASKQISNIDLSQVMETNHEWIVERTGIHTRYFSETEQTSDLGARAAQMAIIDAQIDPSTIDLILCATITPDAMMPATAALIQGKLGLAQHRALAFDINVACSGFVVALQMADAYLSSKMAKRVLIVGSETLSKVLDFSDRGSAILFGDGAGAVIVEHQADHRAAVHLAYSEYDQAETLNNDVTPLNPTMSLTQAFKGYLRMKGQPVFRFAVKVVQESLHELSQKANIDLQDVDWIVTHQANLRIMDYVAERLKLDRKRFYTNVKQVGNTSSASIPLALSMMKQAGQLKIHQTCMMVGFGAGLTWAASLIEL